MVGTANAAVIANRLRGCGPAAQAKVMGPTRLSNASLERKKSKVGLPGGDGSLIQSTTAATVAPISKASSVRETCRMSTRMTSNRRIQWLVYCNILLAPIL